jgi:hypothetical protein
VKIRSAALEYPIIRGRKKVMPASGERLLWGKTVLKLVFSEPTRRSQAKALISSSSRTSNTALLMSFLKAAFRAFNVSGLFKVIKATCLSLSRFRYSYPIFYPPGLCCRISGRFGFFRSSSKFIFFIFPQRDLPLDGKLCFFMWLLIF